MSLLDRVRDLLRRNSEPQLTTDEPGLSVVAEAFDAAEADSAVLARSHLWDEGKPAVLRHHLTLPAGRVAEAERVLAQDGWELRTVSESDGVATLHALRVQRLDALHCAQERSRMAGLAARLGGDALGWDALQRPGAG
ncbi:hypothetical protein SAMN05421835_1506 [Amycolatopsis sacchari]|uniref:Uncharacterized protein n=1 Tax=Amycolatopsis sacchari TaxID=115433 RepID=A0A1I4DQB6_9PSEU|nr:hypothetical protein [Amycolatopsis sacchari]SFK94226.1 hypothetical protein SAMN05421835_1506 [Amycolatopsis sacchari]